LNPSDKKRRKEPVKPWSRKERILILVLIILTAGTSGFLAVSAGDYKLPGFPRIKFSIPSVEKFFKGETIVLEGIRDEQMKTDQVVDKLNEATLNLSGVYGLKVIRLNNGSSYGVNDNEIFQAASLIKLPLMAAMYIRSEIGNLDLDSKYTLKNSDKVTGAGSLYGKPAGYQITYRNLIRLMGKQSDNTAFNICRKLIGDKEIDSAALKIGMDVTNVENNETSPSDVGVFFEELWNGNIVNKENKDELLEFLTDTSFENWIPEGVPGDVRVAHKVGIETHVINDAGIVYAKSPYVVVILSKGVVEREANQAFPELSKIIYEAESAN
jgi:beta-lactamase class A